MIEANLTPERNPCQMVRIERAKHRTKCPVLRGAAAFSLQGDDYHPPREPEGRKGRTWPDTGSPVDGSSRSVSRLGPLLKSNMLFKVPASASKEPVNPLTAKPVVFDEAQDRALVGDRVIHIVLLGARRDHQQRQARTVTATALRMGCSRRRAKHSSRCRTRLVRSAHPLLWRIG